MRNSIRRSKLVMAEVGGQRGDAGLRRWTLASGEGGWNVRGIKAQGCSSEGASPVVPVPGKNCLVEQNVVGSAKGTLGVNWKGTWSGCGVSA